MCRVSREDVGYLMLIQGGSEQFICLFKVAAFLQHKFTVNLNVEPQ